MCQRSNEPGIGKSRITEAMQERLSAEPHTRLRFFCSPYHQDSALYPAIAQYRAFSDIAAARLKVLPDRLGFRRIVLKQPIDKIVGAKFAGTPFADIANSTI
jgi:predicted ATPase